jgi:fructose-bisphosphate aldolase, class I
VGNPYVTAQDLIGTARALVADDKGLLAMDESTPTCNRRFAALGIPQTEEVRRAYRELIITTPGLGECISGAILYDETVKAIISAGVIPGIKVDAGAKDMAGYPGEKVTEGLDGLRDRLEEYSRMGARFAKWRAVIALGTGIPSRGCIEANAQALARYAASCQEAGLVPVVEPEVLMDGDHTLEQCRQVTEEVLRTVFAQLCGQRVMLEGMILKPNMVLPGLTCPLAGSGRRGGRRHREVSPADSSRCRSGDCVPLRRPVRRIGLGPLERHECQVQVPRALGGGVFVCPRHPATGVGDLARRGRLTCRRRSKLSIYHRAACNRAAPRGEYTVATEST